MKSKLFTKQFKISRVGFWFKQSTIVDLENTKILIVSITKKIWRICKDVLYFLLIVCSWVISMIMIPFLGGFMKTYEERDYKRLNTKNNGLYIRKL